MSRQHIAAASEKINFVSAERQATDPVRKTIFSPTPKAYSESKNLLVSAGFAPFLLLSVEFEKPFKLQAFLVNDQYTSLV